MQQPGHKEGSEALEGRLEKHFDDFAHLQR